MSNKTYNELWIKTQKKLQEVLQEEHSMSSSKPEKDLEVAFQSVSKLYLQYVQVFRSLDKCFDQIVHPQKRILLRQILVACIGRILELKQELVNLDHLEYSYHDETVAALGLSPDEAELIIPGFILRDRTTELSYWADRMKEAREKLEQSNLEAKGVTISVADAILLLQRHERARQGRLRANLMEEIRKQEASVADKAAKAKADETLSSAMAASKIQSIWKGALTRRRVRKQREDELAFIGMIPPAEFSREYQDRLDNIEDERRVIQKKHADDYEEALVQLKDELKEKEGEDIEEEMKENIRSWYFNNRDDQGRFPDYPSDDEGGSELIFHPERHGGQALEGGVPPSGLPLSPRPGPGLVPKDIDKRSATSSNKKKEQEVQAKPRERQVEKKSKDPDDDESGFVLRTTDFVRQLKAGQKTFNDLWIRRKGLHLEGVVMRRGNNLQELNDRCFASFDTWKDKDESKNKVQNFDKDIILSQKRGEVEDEIRHRVDAQMREELDLLKIAAERDKGRKGKIAKKRKKGKKKAGKKGKKKKDKDLTPDRSLESLFEELVINGVIKTFPKVPIAKFVGEMNLVGGTMKKREGSKDPTPGPGDIRRAVIENCILPMSSSFLREHAPHVKSLLLVGPEGTGKTMLLHAICTELGATLFDLTATNIVGKYPGKSGLNMLLHLVIKVSKLLQPAVIFLDQAEKTFVKKVSKTDKSDPKRLKKDLPRLVRSLTSEDRVLLIGASRAPWECEQKGLAQTYQKVLLLPKPDYGSRYSIWKELIISRGGKILSWTDKFDISALAKVSDGYTAGHIAQAIQTTLTERRIMQQGVKPLKPMEFVPALAKHEPVYREQEEAYEVWFAKTAMGKRRTKYVEGDEEEALKKEKKKFTKKKKAS